MSDYYSVEISIRPYSEDAADLLAAFLADIGYESFVTTETGLTAYVQAELFDPRVLKATIEEFPMDVEADWISEFIEQRDWNEEWEKRYFKPLLLGGGKCVVHSSFHEDYPAAPVDITIDPKMAFGTGHHATTSMMVDHLFNIDLKGATVTDMGTGTGILAIVAKKLGAARVMGIEIDDVACENARENVILNDVEAEIINGDSSSLECLEEADVFLANINRNIIIADLDRYAGALRPGGIMLLSGFYKDDIPMLEGSLRHEGLEIESTVYTDEGWASIRAIKKY